VNNAVRQAQTGENYYHWLVCYKLTTTTYIVNNSVSDMSM